ncbi:MAG: hypothetical protein KDE47_01415, partial [Caldilineaceae bacterium]|nr:hypothetical protein [Caldilineaceae bacterium]
YSAENGHPTLTNDSVSYLQSVPDRFALGQERWGHGYGLSQWGAYRRAKAGQTYRQILGHYYSHIYLRDATAPERPIGALLGDEPPYLLATDSIYLSAMHAPNAALRYEISASATLTEPVIIARASLSNTTLIWRAAQPLPAAAQITASLWISDMLQDTLTWTVDHEAPSAPLFAPPAVITTTAITLAIGAETGQPLVSAGWQWPGAPLFHTANSGEVVSDSAAATGTAWHAAPGLHSAGVWYGPYTTALPAGHSYRALFWLRAAIGTEQTTGALPIARLDVTDDEGRVGLGLRDLHAADFADTLHYHPIAVDFHLFGAPKGLEFRVAWAGNTDLTLDRVEIWQLPDAMRTADSAAQQQMSATMNALSGWSLKSGAPTATADGFMQPIELRAMDAAGNLSASTAYSLTFVDQEPPQFAAVAEPQGWIRTRDFTLTAVVSDTGSGIDLGAGSVIVDGEDTAGNPISSTLPVLLRQQADTPTSATMRATLHDFPDGRYIAAFAAFDQVGNRAILPHPVRIDTVAPTVTLVTTLPTDDNVNGPWSTTPLTINITAIDQESGVQEIFYATPFAPNALRVATPYTAPLRLTQGGIYTFTAWAIDQAANQSAPITATYYLDLLPPTVQVTQTAINSTTVHGAWRADDDGSGIALVELQRRQEGEAWQPQPQHYIEPTATLAFAVSPTQQSYVRVRATDYVGRTGEWTELALWAPTDVVYLPLISAAK